MGSKRGVLLGLQVARVSSDNRIHESFRLREEDDSTWCRIQVTELGKSAQIIAQVRGSLSDLQARRSHILVSAVASVLNPRNWCVSVLCVSGGDEKITWRVSPQQQCSLLQSFQQRELWDAGTFRVLAVMPKIDQTSDEECSAQIAIDMAQQSQDYSHDDHTSLIINFQKEIIEWCLTLQRTLLPNIVLPSAPSFFFLSGTIFLLGCLVYLIFRQLQNLWWTSKDGTICTLQKPPGKSFSHDDFASFEEVENNNAIFQRRNATWTFLQNSHNSQNECKDTLRDLEVYPDESIIADPDHPGTFKERSGKSSKETLAKNCL